MKIKSWKKGVKNDKPWRQRGMNREKYEFLSKFRKNCE